MHNNRTTTTTVLLILLLLLIVGNQAYAADTNSITISVDKTRVNMGDVLHCQVVISLQNEDVVSDISTPNFKGFKIQNSNTSKQYSTSMINFSTTTTRTTTITTMLTPLAPGKVVIGPATFRENGRLINSNKVEILVQQLDAGDAISHVGEQAINAPLSVAESETSGLFVRLISERDDLVEGESFAVTLYLYSSGVQPRRWGQVNQPDFKGFTTNRLEMPKQRRGQNTIINRKQYSVEPLDRFLLTARRAGDYTISPYQVKILINDNSFFDQKWLYRSSNPLKLSVAALPEAGKSPGFSTAYVGQFNFSGRIDRRKTEVGQPVTLVLSLSANKNIDNVRMPRMPNILGAKVYPPTESKDNYQQGLRMSGRRSAEYLIVPNKVGTFKIPALSFKYFDTKEKKYKTIKTREYKIVATKPNGKSNSAFNGYIQKQDLILNPDALRPPVPTTKFTNIGGSFFKSNTFLVLFYAPLIIILLLSLFDLMKRILPKLKNAEKAKLIKQVKLLEEKLESSPDKLDSEFAGTLSRLIYLKLEIKFDISMSGLTYEQGIEHLKASQLEDQQIDKLISIFKQIDLARYAPRDAAAKDLLNLVNQWFAEVGR